MACSAWKTIPQVAGETEDGVYEALGLPWIPPELRENCGEIEARRKAACRSWSSSPDIRGDLHMHTTETDGRASLEEMAEAARARLRIHRHHRSFQGARHGQRAG